MIQGVSVLSLVVLVKQPWRANFRVLENTFDRGVVLVCGELLLPENLILDASFEKTPRQPSLSAGMTVREMEKELIVNTLNQVGDNRTHAAKMLGISIRTLRNKLNEYREEMDMSVE